MALNPDTLKILYRNLTPSTSASLNAASDLSRLSQYVAKVAKETPYGKPLPNPVKNALQAPYHGSDWAWMLGGPRYRGAPTGPLADLAGKLYLDDSTGGALRKVLESAQLDFSDAVDSMSAVGNRVYRMSDKDFLKRWGF